MKIEGRIFMLGVAFFLPIAFIYWYLSRDPIGTTALALSGALAFLVGFYVLYTAKRVYPRPEDRLEANIDEASPHSWWPLPVAFGAFITALGLIFAVWVIVLGVGILMLALVGWMFEYYRGDFAQ